MKHIIAIFLVLLSCLSISAEVRIHMEKEGGVYKVPCSVNGLKLKFIFDTGAANVCISGTYADMMLENGYLEESDIKGVSQSTIADGSNIDNVVINLRKVEIGGLSLENVSAVVVPSQNAPLLLGQSVIQRLGKVSIDGEYLVIHNAACQYTEEELDAIFEKAEEMYDNDIDSEALKYYKIIYEAYGDETNPWVLYKMGICYSRLKDYQTAMNCHLKAIDLDEGNDEDGLLFKVYPILAILYSLNDENEKELDCLKLALKYAPDESEKVGLYIQIGTKYSSVFNSNPDYFNSLKYYDEAIKILEKLQNNNLGPYGEIQLIETYCFKAKTLEQLHRYEDAIETYNKAKKMNDKKHVDVFETQMNKGLSDCYKELSNRH